jgi:protein-tyrosine phosphatase
VPDSASDVVRNVPLSGCFNFRDLGGYGTSDGGSIRWRRLFRADGLARLDSGDCGVLAEIGLSTVIDLRTIGEAQERGRFPGELLSVDYQHVPLIDVLPPESELERYAEAAFVTSRYRQIFDEGQESITNVLEILARPGSLPAVFHCSAGKDRTGVLAALTLGFLGVPLTVIAEDYALSGPAMQRMFVWMRENNSGSAESFDRLAPAVLSAPSESMTAFLHAVFETYGGFEGLASHLGVTSAVDRLRRELVEYDSSVGARNT